MSPNSAFFQLCVARTSAVRSSRSPTTVCPLTLCTTALPTTLFTKIVCVTQEPGVTRATDCEDLQNFSERSDTPTLTGTSNRPEPSPKPKDRLSCSCCVLVPHVAEVLARWCLRCHQKRVKVVALKRCYNCSCCMPNPHAEELLRRCSCFRYNQAASQAAHRTIAAPTHLGHETEDRAIHPGHQATRRDEKGTIEHWP